MLQLRYHHATLCLLLISRATIAYMPDAETFDAPSMSIRGALKAAIKHDYEDVVVMQTEMAWGANEMKKYKSIKGEWPVRSSLDEKGQEQEEEDDTAFLRKKDGEPNPEDADTDYWNYLVSIF